MNQLEVQRLQTYLKRRLGNEADKFDMAEMDTSLEYHEAKKIMREKLRSFLHHPLEKGIDSGEISTRNLVVNFNRQIDQAVAEKLAQEVALSKEKEALALSLIKSGGSEEAKAILQGYFAPIRDITQAIATSGISMAILSGRAGISKSFTCISALNELGLKPFENYVVITGHITPLKFYACLFQNKEKGKIVILDDIDVNTLKSPLFCAMIKAASWSASGSRFLMWNSYSKMLEADAIPASYQFEGKLILLTNSLPDNPEFEAVKSRALIKELTFSFSELKAIFAAISKQPYDGLFDEQKIEVCDYLFSELSMFNQNMNLRMLIMGFELRKSQPDKWKSTLKHLLGLTDDQIALKEAMESSPYREEQAKAYFLKSGLSRRSYYRRVRELKV